MWIFFPERTFSRWDPIATNYIIIWQHMVNIHTFFALFFSRKNSNPFFSPFSHFFVVSKNILSTFEYIVLNSSLRIFNRLNEYYCRNKQSVFISFHSINLNIFCGHFWNFVFFFGWFVVDFRFLFAFPMMMSMWKPIRKNVKLKTLILT